MSRTGPGTSQRGLDFGGGQGFAVGRETQAITSRGARENTVRSWYQNVQRLMSLYTRAEPPAFKGKAITESWSALIHAVSPPTQTLVVRPGIASRSSSFRPILGRRQYDRTCHTKTRVGTSQKTVPTVFCHTATEYSWSHTLREGHLGMVRRPVCGPWDQRACSHTWPDISAHQVWIANESGGLFAGALGVF